MPDVTAARLWALNHRVLISVLRDCDRDFDALDLDAKEFFVLAAVPEWPYPAELADGLVIPKASVSVYVRNLESQGLLGRQIDPGDLRRHRLHLTPRGQDVLERALEALSGVFEERLGRLTAVERVQLGQLLDKLVTDAPAR